MTTTENITDVEDDTDEGFQTPSQDLAVQDEEFGLSVLPPARTPQTAAVAQLAQHAANMDAAHRLAAGMCATALVPKQFRGKPKDGTAAILYGAELGLTPIQSLQRVIVIHGMPGLEARTMKAILKSHGYQFRTIEKTDTVHEVWAWEPTSPVVLDEDGLRVNPDEEARWTIEDCKREGWVPTPVEGSQERPDVTDDWVTVTKTFNNESKKSIVGNIKYITSPRTMLTAKATADVCRSIAPHILLGMPYATEELESFDRDDDQPRSPRASSRKGRGLRARAAEARAAAEEPVDAEIVDDTEPEPTPPATPEAPKESPGLSAAARKKWQDRMFVLFGEAKVGAREDQLAVMAAITGKPAPEHRDQLSDDDLKKVVNKLHAWRETGKTDDELREILDAPALIEEDDAQQSTEGNQR